MMAFCPEHPKSGIYTPKRDDEHPHPFHMRSPPPPGRSIEKAGNPHPFIIQPRHPTLTAVSGHFSLPDHSTKDIHSITINYFRQGQYP